MGLASGINLYQYAPNPLGWIDHIYGLPEVEWVTRHGGRQAFIYGAFGSQTQYFTYDDENRLIKARRDGPQGRYETSYR